MFERFVPLGHRFHLGTTFECIKRIRARKDALDCELIGILHVKQENTTGNTLIIGCPFAFRFVHATIL